MKFFHNGSLFLTLCLLLFPQIAFSQAYRNDPYLEGYITSIIERELKWPRDTYRIEVRDGVATITIPEETKQARTSDIERLNKIDGIEGLQIAVGTLKEGKITKNRALRWMSKALGMSKQVIFFPVGDLFKPLLADPKQPQFFISFLRYSDPAQPNRKIPAASVGYGEAFGIYRFLGRRPQEGVQFNIEGALFAQFDLEARSKDLINADYVLGFPLTYRKNDFSAKFRLYHQSSHLGDEFLLNARANRVNLSYEAAELIASYELNNFRGYLGGEELMRKEPEDLDRFSLHTGAEYESKKRIWRNARLVVGLDLKSYKQHDWDVDTSFKGGLKFGQTESGRRHVKILAEAYKGHSPNGQFYDARISYFGLGLYLGL